ncbi:MAG: sensor histidine kinase [Bacteroidales bacterium]|nr:sensor histidine kinase [Bacteroidales bacterium]
MLKALIDVENPTIIWKAFQKKNKIYLSVTDNGPGANKAQFKALYNDKEVAGIKTGLGLHLIRDLATAIDCEITVDTRVGFGTTILLALDQKSGT